MLSIHIEDRVTILACHGRICEGREAATLCGFATDLLYSHQKVVIDFASVQYIDSAGLEILGDLFRLAHSLGHPGVFTPVLAEHTKSFNLIDTLAVGVDRIQRNFESLQRQVELWRKTQVTDERAKLIFYSAFIDGVLDAPRSLLPEVLSSAKTSFASEKTEAAARVLGFRSRSSRSEIIVDKGSAVTVGFQPMVQMHLV